MTDIADQQEINRLNGEVERLRRVVVGSALECADQKTRAQVAEIERDRLRPALEGMVHYATHNEGWQDDHPEYLEAARAALGGAS